MLELFSKSKKSGGGAQEVHHEISHRVGERKLGDGPAVPDGERVIEDVFVKFPRDTDEHGEADDEKKMVPKRNGVRMVATCDCVMDGEAEEPHACASEEV